MNTANFLGFKRHLSRTTELVLLREISTSSNRSVIYVFRNSLLLRPEMEAQAVGVAVMVFAEDLSVIACDDGW